MQCNLALCQWNWVNVTHLLSQTEINISLQFQIQLENEKGVLLIDCFGCSVLKLIRPLKTNILWLIRNICFNIFPPEPMISDNCNYIRSVWCNKNELSEWKWNHNHFPRTQQIHSAKQEWDGSSSSSSSLFRCCWKIDCNFWRIMAMKRITNKWVGPILKPLIIFPLTLEFLSSFHI